MSCSGTFELAHGLRWDSQYLADPVVKVLTFSIDPSVHLTVRESGPSVTLNLLPLFWTARPNEPSRARSSLGYDAARPRHSHTPSMRNLLGARLSCATHTIRRIHHSSYESYAISTTQNENGSWVAAFGRRHGDMLRAGKPVVSETGPERAEVIALADAQIEIDDRLAGKGTLGILR